MLFRSDEDVSLTYSVATSGTLTIIPDGTTAGTYTFTDGSGSFTGAQISPPASSTATTFTNLTGTAFSACTGITVTGGAGSGALTLPTDISTLTAITENGSVAPTITLNSAVPGSASAAGGLTAAFTTAAATLELTAAEALHASNNIGFTTSGTLKLKWAAGYNSTSGTYTGTTTLQITDGPDANSMDVNLFGTTITSLIFDVVPSAAQTLTDIPSGTTVTYSASGGVPVTLPAGISYNTAGGGALAITLAGASSGGARNQDFTTGAAVTTLTLNLGDGVDASSSIDVVSSNVLTSLTITGGAGGLTFADIAAAGTNLATLHLGGVTGAVSSLTLPDSVATFTGPTAYAATIIGASGSGAVAVNFGSGNDELRTGTGTETFTVDMGTGTSEIYYHLTSGSAGVMTLTNFTAGTDIIHLKNNVNLKGLVGIIKHADVANVRTSAGEVLEDDTSPTVETIDHTGCSSGTHCDVSGSGVNAIYLTGTTAAFGTTPPFVDMKIGTGPTIDAALVPVIYPITGGHTMIGLIRYAVDGDGIPDTYEDIIQVTSVTAADFFAGMDDSLGVYGDVIGGE